MRGRSGVLLLVSNPIKAPPNVGCRLSELRDLPPATGDWTSSKMATLRGSDRKRLATNQLSGLTSDFEHQNTRFV